MNAPVKTGGSALTNLEVAAERGNPVAIKALAGRPSRPYLYEHVWMWHKQLSRGLGRSEFGGTGSLDWVKFDRWAHRMRVDPSPVETMLLFDLDEVARHPEILDVRKD